MERKNTRPDHIGPNRSAYEKQKKRLLELRPQPCPLCGGMINYAARYPAADAPEIDHIVPISRGGHPTDPDNLQVVHHKCNREKANKLQSQKVVNESGYIGNRNLPLSIDWKNYKPDD